MAAATEAAVRSVDETERLRANVYALLARFLARPPDEALHNETAGWQGDESEFGRAISKLAKLAAGSDPRSAKHEYEDLFIGVGRGELVPYGSYYLTGFLYEKPLARVRQSLRELGVERDPSVKDPEDHIAALLDVMVGMILGTFGRPASLQDQKAFFDEHIASWAPYFFKDLEKAEAVRLYAGVGSVGRQFLEIEKAAFSMA
jgi:TorA maturation chaperone TorD